MKKHFILLLALLCASVMGWADCYTATQNTNENDYPLTLTVEKLSDTQTQLSVTSTHSTITGVHVGSTCQGWSDGVVADGENIINNLHTGWNHDGNIWTRVINWATYPTGNLKFYLVMYRNNTGGGSDIMSTTYDGIDASQSCSAGPAKESPELSLNATSKTLEIDATAETFQIVPTKAAGSGAVSYSSSAEGVATVTNAGLVTAVSAGTATITVSVAENDDFAADSKTLTVEVIDWPNTGWVQYGDNAYKLHISPAISDTYGGKRIENGNLWVGFPSAEFGACSIDYTHVGAGASFPLSNFTSHRSQFTMVCQGTTYTLTVYRNFDGVNLAKNMPTYAGHSALPSAEANDGNKSSRWGSENGKHYAQYGDMAEDWWYVDLGAMYEISSIKVLYQDACPNDYDLLTSPNGESWITIGSYNANPATGNTDDKYNEYSFSPGKEARYVKIFARNGTNNLQWGISIWEFEVYGQPAEGYDTTNPVLSSAAVSGTPTSAEVKIAVSATDNSGDVTVYHVVDNSMGINRNCTVSEGKITISGLLDGETYNFSVTALDAIGNHSNAIVVVASTAQDPSNPVTTAPVPPSRSADDVRAIYSDAYTNILQHSFVKHNWGSSNETERVKSSDNYLVYDISSNNNVTWGTNGGGTEAIVANEGYHAEGKTGLDASGMEYLHVDIWSQVALTGINVRIEDAIFTTITHDGTGWNSYDLELAGSSVDFTNIRFVKIEGMTAATARQKMAVDNYYFWKAPSGVKAVVVSTNNGSWGSVTAKVDEDDVTSVAINTEVTFTATPEEGYDFAYWTINGNRVYENPYTLAIAENTNAVATFETERTPYCVVPVTDIEGRTLYLTVSSPSANTYKILFEGSADNRIGSDDVYLNTQFRLNNVNGVSVYHFAYKGERDASDWHVTAADENSYGSAYILFTAEDFHDISVAQQGVDLIRAAGGLSSFNAFPDASLIKWDATCADAAAPELAAPTATAIGPKSVRLTLSATDDMAALLTYHVNYKQTGDAGEGTNVDVAGASGEPTYKNITGLTSGVAYTFSITVSDGTNTSEAQSCSATPTMPTAPVPPVRPANYVRSIYSDTYETMLDADFGKTSFAAATIEYEELNVSGNHCLFYDLLPHDAAAGFAIGGLNPGDIFVAKEVYQGDITEKENRTTPDVSEMTHLHIDVWSDKATQYAEVQINGVKVIEIPLTGSGWQQFDLPLATFKTANLAQLKDLKHINFVGLRDPNPEEIAIDNVYFYIQPTAINFADNATDNSDVITANADKIANVTINRAIAADNTWYTLCLPFDMSADKVNEVFGVSKIATLTGSEERGSLIHLNFDYVNKIEAGMPYLFKAGSDFAASTTISGVTIKNVDPIETGDALMKFIGTYNQIVLDEPNQRFVADDNYLYSPAAGGTTMGAFRCYFTIPNGSSAGAPGRQAKIVFDPQTATGCENVATPEKPSKIMINGTLYILRDGKTYTAEGLLVE